MSEHPDWRQFKLEQEHNDYLSDLGTEDEVRIIINGVNSHDMPLSEEEWKAILAGYELMEKDGVDE